MDGSGRSKKSLTVNELEPGMILAEKIVSDDTVLVNSGVVITETIINRLKSQYIFEQIEVFSDEDGEINFVKVIKEKTVEEIEQTFKELTFNVEGIFESINTEGLTDIDEVEKFAKKIQGDLNSARTVIKDIVLNGSGEDVIYRHSVNVAALSAILGKWIGFSDEQIGLLTCSAILHDFGKTKIDKSILDKFGESKPEESIEIKNHPLLGYNIIKDIPGLEDSVAQGVLLHHERINGTGYPSGVKGDKIHPFARIIAIADTFDEINSLRQYSSPQGPFEALEVIKKESFGQLDYEYSKIFLEHVINFYISENVLLSNNNIAQIIQIDSNDIDRPLLLDASGFIDLKKERNIEITKLLL